VILLCGGPTGRMVTAPLAAADPRGTRCLPGDAPGPRRAVVVLSDQTLRPGVWQRHGLLSKHGLRAPDFKSGAPTDRKVLTATPVPCAVGTSEIAEEQRMDRCTAGAGPVCPLERRDGILQTGRRTAGPAEAGQQRSAEAAPEQRRMRRPRVGIGECPPEGVERPVQVGGGAPSGHPSASDGLLVTGCGAPVCLLRLLDQQVQPREGPISLRQRALEGSRNAYQATTLYRPDRGRDDTVGGRRTAARTVGLDSTWGGRAGEMGAPIASVVGERLSPTTYTPSSPPLPQAARDA
jgi:hypothetical protein